MDGERCSQDGSCGHQLFLNCLRVSLSAFSSFYLTQSKILFTMSGGAYFVWTVLNDYPP